jgi:hypothetical protein
MRLVLASLIAVALAVPATLALQQDADVAVANGGIHVAGWHGVAEGGDINESRITGEGGTLALATGPAATYWNPENTASGDYTISATFTEASQKAPHPHPFGLFIGGKNLGTDSQSFLYCVAYRNGRYLVRGFRGSEVFTVSPSRASHDTVHQAAADQSVTQEIAWRVSGGTAECLVNGQVVGSYSQSDLVGDGKLESTDGVFGIRIGHNVEATVTGFGKQ